jgi:hypothetical protein
MMGLTAMVLPDLYGRRSRKPKLGNRAMLWARCSAQVRVDISGEYAQRTAHHGRGTVRVVACATTIDLDQTPQESGHELRISLAVGQASQIVGDGREPKDTGPALPRAFFGQETGNTCRFSEAASVSSEHDDDPHPE